MKRLVPIFLALALVAVAAAGLVSCSEGDEHTTVLPTVQGSAPPEDPFISCHDFCGDRPDRLVQRVRAEASPKFCFIGEECFFNCPPRRRCR